MSQADDAIGVALNLAGYYWAEGMSFNWFYDDGHSAGNPLGSVERAHGHTACAFPLAHSGSRVGLGDYESESAGKMAVERYVATARGLIAALPRPSKRSPRHARNSKTEP
jgi:hypothetical protein